MSTKQAKRWLGVAVVWIVIFGALAVLGRHYDVLGGNGPPPPGPGGGQPGGRSGKDGGGSGGAPPVVVKKKIWLDVSRATIRFSPGTASMRPFCEADIKTLADKLNADPQCRVRTIGHISPGSKPEEELQLALDQVKEVGSRLRDKGVSDERILTETSTKSDENGAYGVVTCIVEKKKEGE
ncbi:MAG: OmpA family protein [Phycisphaerae bacterium]|nr:OmpA family protein [Planctomycetota bacterium]MBL7220776.1 OmpA family protein [Phycisphaerae bacterium]